MKFLWSLSLINVLMFCFCRRVSGSLTASSHNVVICSLMAQKLALAVDCVYSPFENISLSYPLYKNCSSRSILACCICMDWGYKSTCFKIFGDSEFDLLASCRHTITYGILFEASKRLHMIRSALHATLSIFSRYKVTLIFKRISLTGMMCTFVLPETSIGVSMGFVCGNIFPMLRKQQY